MVSEKEKQNITANDNDSKSSVYNAMYNFGEYIFSV